jgi:hypothetical protein
MTISDNLVGIVAVTVGVGAPMIAWIITNIFNNWRTVKTSEHLAALKQTMVERGMSAEEIERIINAGMPLRKKACQQDSQLEHVR